MSARSVSRLISLIPKPKFNPSSFPSLSSSSSSSSKLLTQKRFFSTEAKNNTHSHEHTHEHHHKTEQHTQQKTANAKENENNNNTTTNGNGNAEQKPSPLEEAHAKITKLQSDLDAFKDQHMRVLAEMENTRRIAKKDVADAKVFGIQSFAKSLFEIGDNLSLALDAVPKDQLESNVALKLLYEGVQMTEKGYLKALSEHGVTRYSPLGEKFNPYHHQALYEIVDSTKETGTVANVMKDGYLLKDRVLRPASVGVYKGNPPQKSQTPPS
eukprot:TRINITY_DN1336_c0_g1_i1.p1 TRINITY_DN1336_c0_g1~~TRINITY_DN1336_c0_g1_i1.p1  ORF type:complete len:269 (+),score=71.09 TRINITY_DN1336_c0_g1_i1:152-958(+)